MRNVVSCFMVGIYVSIGSCVRAGSCVMVNSCVIVGSCVMAGSCVRVGICIRVGCCVMMDSCVGTDRCGWFRIRENNSTLMSTLQSKLVSLELTLVPQEAELRFFSVVCIIQTSRFVFLA